MTPTAKRAKQKARHQAERAVAWIIANHGKTYRQASALFDVPVHAIRARVNHRHGSLDAARRGVRYAGNDALDHKLWARPCLSCGSTEPRPRGQYRCARCREQAERVHDGGV